MSHELPYIAAIDEAIHLEMVRVWPLETVHVVPLECVDRQRGAVDTAASPVAVEPPTLPDSPVVVDTTGDRALRQKGHALLQVAMRRREDKA